MSEIPSPAAQDVWWERMRLNGQILSAFAYGVFVTIVIHYLDTTTSGPRKGYRRWPTLLYVAVLVILETITFIGQANYNQTIWVDGRNLPGGPDAQIANAGDSNVGRMATVSCMTLRWVSDALLIYRCYVVWSAERFVALITTLPALVLVADITFGILTLVQMWHHAPFSGIKFTVPDFCLSVSNNIVVTLLIVARLLAARRKVKPVLASDYLKTYTSIAAMLIESAALYSVTGLIFIIAFARQSHVQELVLLPLGIVQGIAPMLIMLRVARGRAWSNELNTTITSASQSRGAPTFTTLSARGDAHFNDEHVSLDFATASQAEKSDLGESASVLFQK